MPAVAEGREHRQLVRCLLRHLQDSHVSVLGADARGWPASPLVGRRRPDVFGYYRTGGAVIAGEAKRGPELWASRTQIADLARHLPALGPRNSGAVLVLAVGHGYLYDAADMLSTLELGRTTVTIWSPVAAA